MPLKKVSEEHVIPEEEDNSPKMFKDCEEFKTSNEYEVY